jgi:hypothetical protein
VRYRVLARRAAATLLGVLLATVAAGAAAQGDGRPSTRRPTISGAFIDAANGVGAFSGNLALTRFEMRQRSLVVVGTLSGVLAESNGRIIGRVNQEVVLPVSGVTGTCQLLHLEIGPLDQKFLGVRVQLENSALGITAREGPDRALLCSTADLLGTNPTLESLATKLNAVLARLDPSR